MEGEGMGNSGGGGGMGGSFKGLWGEIAQWQGTEEVSGRDLFVQNGRHGHICVGIGDDSVE